MHVHVPCVHEVGLDSPSHIPHTNPLVPIPLSKNFPLLLCMEKIRVGLVDDNLLIRQGMTHLLSQTPDISLLWQGNGREWITFLEEQSPDLLLIDFDMPTREELEITHYIHVYHSTVKVVAFSNHSNEAHSLAMIEAGASGYISKATKPDKIVSAIRIVAAGSLYFDNHARNNRRIIPSLSTPNTVLESDKNLLILSQQLAKISLRERDILQQVAEGKTCPEIAETLFISKDTVRNHKANISQKLNLKGRNQLFSFAIAAADLLRNNAC